jgi:hypothetical protein
VKLPANKAFSLVRQCLSDDLRREEYQGEPNEFRGHCYVASEALYHLMDKRRGFKPHTVQIGGETHWFLMIPGKINVLDPTFDQFDSPLPWCLYQDSRGRGFLTKKPSRRARILIARVKERLRS